MIAHAAELFYNEVPIVAAFKSVFLVVVLDCYPIESITSHIL